MTMIVCIGLDNTADVLRHTKTLPDNTGQYNTRHLETIKATSGGGGVVAVKFMLEPLSHTKK